MKSAFGCRDKPYSERAEGPGAAMGVFGGAAVSPMEAFLCRALSVVSSGRVLLDTRLLPLSASVFDKGARCLLAVN